MVGVGDGGYDGLVGVAPQPRRLRVQAQWCGLGASERLLGGLVPEALHPVEGYRASLGALHDV